MTWVGLERYGYLEDAQRLAYRWLYMYVEPSLHVSFAANICVRMTTAFVDFNGVVPEKFDAVKLSHLVDAEYGNQGVDFKMVPREGFGWMNGLHIPYHATSSTVTHQSLARLAAAYQVGLTYLSTGMRRAVSACTSPEVFFGNQLNPQQAQAYAAATNDPLGLAMDTLNLSSPVISPTSHGSAAHDVPDFSH